MPAWRLRVEEGARRQVRRAAWFERVVSGFWPATSWKASICWAAAVEGGQIVSGEAFVEAEVEVGGVDALGGVGVEGAGVEVEAVGRLGGVGGEDAVDPGAFGGVGGEGGAFREEGDENVAVDHAADGALGEVDGEVAEGAEGAGEAAAEGVLAAGFDAADLEEGAGVEDAVLMAVVEFAVPGGDFGGRGEEGLGAGGVALFAGEGADFDGGFGEDLDAIAEADVGFLGGVGIDEIDGDVFVAHGFGAEPGGGFGGSGGGLGRVGQTGRIISFRRWT